MTDATPSPATPELTCTKCKAAVDPLAMFPGTLCLECYRPIGDALARTMTAEDLTRMWGGNSRR